eukprot:1191057-Prorocentrum_minimum.AAC.6
MNPEAWEFTPSWGTCTPTSVLGIKNNQSDSVGAPDKGPVRGACQVVKQHQGTVRRSAVSLRRETGDKIQQAKIGRLKELFPHLSRGVILEALQTSNQDEDAVAGEDDLLFQDHSAARGVRNCAGHLLDEESVKAFKQAEAGGQSVSVANAKCPKGWGQALGSGSPLLSATTSAQIPIYVGLEMFQKARQQPYRLCASLCCSQARRESSAHGATSTSKTASASSDSSAQSSRPPAEIQVDDALQSLLVEEMAAAHAWVDADIVKVRPSTTNQAIEACVTLTRVVLHVLCSDLVPICIPRRLLLSPCVKLL